MNPSRKTPADSGSDDPWEQLAEDLFGLEFGKEHAAVVPVRETEVVAPAPIPAPAAIERPAVSETSEEPRPAKAPLGGAAPAADLPEMSSAAPAAFDEIPVRPATPSAQDSYWDALANWKWDESEAPGGKGKPSGSRPDAPRGGRPPSRQESRPDSRQGERPARSGPPASAPAASARAEKAEFGDFGLGVGSSPTSGATPSRREAAETAGLEAGRGSADDDASESDELGEAEDFTNDEEAGESAGPASGDENAPRKRRRRRRRRRSRSGEGEATGSAVSGEPSADREKPAEPARPRSEESPRAPEREGGRERHRRDEESRPPRRGRRDRRGHGAPVADERHEFSDDEFGALSTDDEPMNAGDEVRSDHPADDDGDFGEPAVNYDDVPTWEEAISYLLHPNQVQVESSGGSGSAPGGGGSGEQSRQNRHYGGRRR